MNRLGNRCARWHESIGLLASGALPDAEMAEVREHLAGCTDCWKYYEELKTVTAPFADWENVLSRVQPEPVQQTRWANAIQQAAAAPRPVRRPTPAIVFHTLWRELIRPCRGAWAGMAVLWLVMWGIHLKLSGGETMAANARSAPGSAIWQSIQEQRQVLAELIPPTANEPAERPRLNPPRTQPRSENWTRWRIG